MSLWSIVGVIVLIWIILQILKVGGGLVHLLLLIALAVGLYKILTNRKEP